MAKGFIFDETAKAEPLSTSATTVPTSTATTSTAPIAPPLIAATSTNEKLPRNIGFDISSLPPFKNAEEKSDKIEPSQQAEIPDVEPSAPTLTEIVSYNNTSITLSERITIIEALQKAKLAVCHSKSKDAEIQELSTALEEIYGITVAASSRMSQKQADQINEEIIKIMNVRSKIKERKERLTRIANKTNSIDCMDAFIIFLMILRLILDFLCVFFLVTTNNLFEPASIVLVALSISNSIFICFILISYYRNGYGKLNANSKIRRIENVFCILCTMFYGILATLVIATTSAFNAGICGFVSMVICIIQQCLKKNHYGNSNKARRKNSNTHEDIAMMEAGNNLTSYCHTETIIDNGVESTNNQNNPLTENNDSELRISAVENLKTRIQSALIEVLGNGYSESTNAFGNYNGTIMAQNTVQNYRDPSYHRANNPSFFDTFWCWYMPNSTPYYYGNGDCCSGGGGGCACDECCCNCCDDDGGCCEGDGGCCEGDGGCCEGDGGCCEGDGGCCEGDGCCDGNDGGGDDCGDCGDCDI